MSRLSNLLRQVEIQEPQLAADLKREVEALSERRAFGLNFERHIPETVELPNRPVRRGDKVRFLRWLPRDLRTRTTRACSTPTSKLPPWLRSTKCQANSTRKPMSFVRIGLTSTGLQSRGLTDERRAVYDEIKGMSPEPQVIEIQRPRVRTEETENADGNKLETRAGHLMSDSDDNFPIGSLNQWEIEVLDNEMGPSGFQAWYRNPPRPSGDALAIAYQSAHGHWRTMCPDFLFFHGDSENIQVSIVDPHGHHPS